MSYRTLPILIIILASYFILMCFAKHSNVDPTLISVRGPGLRPQDVVMPARYFFIQSFNGNNNSIDERDFTIIIQGKRSDDRSCRIWSNILNRKDGLLIARYKVYETCSQLEITVKYKNQHVALSPYKIKGKVLPDQCYCPKYSTSRFLQAWECETIPTQILKNFEPIGKIDYNVMRPKIIKLIDNPLSVSVCHYVIKNNEIYRKCYGKYVGFKMFSDSILLSLARKVKLPDVELFINLGDWPLSTKDLHEINPIFSWCGSTDTYDIVMPTYELTESTLENMGRVTVDMLSVQGNVEGPWQHRLPKLFWRGRDSNRYRLDLIALSKKHPNLFNASLTNFFFFRDEEDVYGPKTEHVSLFRFFDYKYQLSIDGTVAAYRMPFLLAGGSLVFKPHSKYYEHFYGDLQPNIHYVPVNADLSDLVEKLLWAKEHDAEARLIALRGQEFANDNLLPEHIFCYYLHLLNELSKRTVSEVQVLDDMKLVKQKEDLKIPCDCSTAGETGKDEL